MLWGQIFSLGSKVPGRSERNGERHFTNVPVPHWRETALNFQLVFSGIGFRCLSDRGGEAGRERRGRRQEGRGQKEAMYLLCMYTSHTCAHARHIN